MMKRMLGFLSCAWAAATALKSAVVVMSSDKPLCIKFRFIFFLLLFGLKFNQSCSSKPPDPYSHSHWSPACAPSTPSTPVHLRILVHLRGFEILVGKLICGADLLVSLVLLR